MKNSEFCCSKCGSTSFRRSHRRDLFERAQMVLGLYPFRCLDCKHRFWVNVWRLPKAKSVRCPHCLNLDVTLSQYRAVRPSPWKRLLRAFGARRYSCPLCHHRFFSLKRSEIQQLQSDREPALHS